MMNIYKNGQIDKRSMQEFTYNANVETAISNLNDMWSDDYWFDITVLTNAATRFGNERTHLGTEYEFLRTFHCNYWRTLQPNMVESLGAVSVAYLGVRDIGYDCDRAKFVDLRFEAPSTKVISTKSLAPPRAEDAVEVQKIKSLISRLKSFFVKKKG